MTPIAKLKGHYENFSIKSYSFKTLIQFQNPLIKDSYVDYF